MSDTDDTFLHPDALPLDTPFTFSDDDNIESEPPQNNNNDFEDPPQNNTGSASQEQYGDDITNLNSQPPTNIRPDSSQTS